MIRTIYLLRHGKSQRGIEFKNDFERPLAERGKHDSELMGQFMRQQGYHVDLIVSSAAKRARKTAKRAAAAMKYHGTTQLNENIYLSGARAYLDVIKGLHKTVNAVMLIGHNPDMEELIEILSGEIITLPTAALVKIEVQLGSWKEITEVKGKLIFVKRPKELRSENRMDF